MAHLGNNMAAIWTQVLRSVAMPQRAAAIPLPTVPFPTVAEVLDLEAVRVGHPNVVAGADSLDRPVRWTHVSEVRDVARLLRGGELLLLTGLVLPDDEAGLREYVGALADVGAAGICVELGRRFQKLPRAMIRAAEERHLPLIELQQEIRFVAVSEAVHARIVDSQLAELRASEELHQTFTELSVEGAAPAEVVRQAARIAGRPVILENLAHQVLAYDAAGTDAATLLEGWEARSRAISSNARTGESLGWLATTVGARGHDWGRLLLSCNGPATARDVMLVERGAATLALSRLVERDRETLERQTHRTLLAGLLTHSLPAAETTMRAKALGVPLEGRTLVAVVLRLSARPGEAALETQARLRDFAETAAASVRDAKLIALVGSIDDVSVGILATLSGREIVARAMESLASALARRLGGNSRTTSPVNTVGNSDYVIAVGSAVASVRDARRSFLEAAQVADAAAHQPSLPYYQLADVRLRGLLHLLRDDERLQTYVERELGPLLAYDDSHSTKLIPILTAYLLAGRNKSAAADAAHLSRPSFYDRLHRIETTLDVDLTDVESCLSLHVALMGLDALRRPSPGSR